MPGYREVTAPGSHAVLSRIERCRTAELGYHPAKGGTVVLIAVAALCNMCIIVVATAIARSAARAKKKNG